MKVQQFKNELIIFKAAKMKLVMMFSLVIFGLIWSPRVRSMGICFGGYPECCADGKNSCGPFCASCSRVGEFVRNMGMFAMMGMGMGTPPVFRVINKDPFVGGSIKNAPFPANPFPTNFNSRP